MSRKPPAAADIRPMPAGPGQFAHVCKHLYATRERWQQVAPGLPTRPREEARRAGCSAWQLRTPVYRKACDTCRQWLASDHDRFYQPAYRNALENAIATNSWGRDHKHERKSEMFVGERGVIVIVNRVRGRRQISSAYRSVPRGLPPDEHSPKAFHKQALRRLYDRTGVKGAGS